MSKKIIISAVIILAITVAFAACKNNDDSKNTNDSTSNTDIVVGTVPVTNEEGTTIDVTIYQDASGENYVTNYQGDKIPMTTDESGFSDSPAYLITQTTAPTTTAPAQNSTSTTAASSNDSTTTTTTTTPAGTTHENVTGGHPTIGTGSGVQNTVEWNDIKNPQN